MTGDPKYSKKDKQKWKRRVLAMARRRLGKKNLSRANIAREILARCPDAPTDRAGYLLLEWFVSRPKTAGESTPQRRLWPESQQPHSDDFLQSYEWRRLRIEVIKEQGARCQCCGATPATDGIVIHVDHIKPRKTHPHLALVKSNLQVLCNVCNHGKGNWDTTDWRPQKPAPEPQPAPTMIVQPDIAVGECPLPDIPRKTTKAAALTPVSELVQWYVDTVKSELEEPDPWRPRLVRKRRQ